MPFAIYRCEKIKSVGALTASAAHNARTRPTPNADPSRTQANRQLEGFDGVIPSPEKMKAEWERRTLGVKRKPDAVLAQEVFVGTSPEFYEGLDASAKVTRCLAWQERALRWLREQFGENLMSGTLHADETTPHIAAYVVPVVAAKDGTRWLSAKKLFNPSTLVAHQDSYAAIMADLGLERGVRGSTARHEEVAKFYGQLTKAEPALLELSHALNQQGKFVPPDKSLLESRKAYHERVASDVTASAAPLVAAVKNIEMLTKDAVAVRRENRSLRAANVSLAHGINAAQNGLRQLTDRLRDIPLDAVMRRLGFGEPDREGNESVWRTGEHVLTVNGAKWYDHRAGCGGGKAIDLVCHVMGCPFLDAVGWLAGQWSPNETAAAVRVAAESVVASTPPKGFEELWAYYAQPHSDATRLMRRYLTEERRIEPKLVDALIADGLMHGSYQLWRSGGRRAWSVFRHVDETGVTKGASLRATDRGEGGKRTLGDKTSSFFSAGRPLTDAAQVALVESPIDALSYIQRTPTARVISLAGANVPPAIIPLLGNDARIAIALDADAAGERGSRTFCEYLQQHFPRIGRRTERLRPWLGTRQAKDWNELLVTAFERRKDSVSETDLLSPKPEPLLKFHDL